MPENPLARVIAATTLICLLSSGCSSTAQPLPPAIGLNFATTAAGFNELLVKLPAIPPEDGIGQLRAFCNASGDDGLKRKSAYVLGRHLQAAGTVPEVKEAIERFKQSTDMPALRERAHWHIAECAQTVGDEKTVRQSLAAISRNASDKESRLAALYGLGQSYMRDNDQDKAKEQFTQVVTLAPDSQFGLGSTYYLAEIEIARTGGKNTISVPGSTAAPPAAANATSGASQPPPPRALAALRHYLDTSSDGRFAAEIVSQLQHLDGFEPTVEDHNRFASFYYGHGAYSDALAEWRKADNKHEWFKQATCLLRTGRTSEGKKALQAGIDEHPSDSSVEAAAMVLCRYLTRDGAATVWKGVLHNSPKCASVAMYNVATRAATTSEALPYYREIFSSYPASLHAPDAGWWLAWNDIEAGHSKAAVNELHAVAARYPESKAAPRCLFWVGKLYERMGQKPLAKKSYETTIRLHARSYYGHRAAARLAALSGGKDRGWSTTPERHVKWLEDTSEEWSFPEPPQQLAHQEGTTVELLTELRQWDECLDLLKDKNGLLRAFYLAKLGMPLNAINAAYASIGNTPEQTEAWQLAYPLLHARFIAAEAPTKRVDPFLVQALIREESRYNVQAVSGSNAIGLMQLLPGTAYGVAKRLGIHLSGTEDIHKPENNLRMGIDYLSYTLHRFNGSALHAVASYNGGPNAVQRWSARWHGDPDIFVENIPFTETRDYVRKVFGSYWNYEAVYTARHQPGRA